MTTRNFLMATGAKGDHVAGDILPALSAGDDTVQVRRHTVIAAESAGGQGKVTAFNSQTLWPTFAKILRLPAFYLVVRKAKAFRSMGPRAIIDGAHLVFGVFSRICHVARPTTPGAPVGSVTERLSTVTAIEGIMVGVGASPAPLVFWENPLTAIKAGPCRFLNAVGSLIVSAAQSFRNGCGIAATKRTNSIHDNSFTVRLLSLYHQEV